MNIILVYQYSSIKKGNKITYLVISHLLFNHKNGSKHIHFKHI